MRSTKKVTESFIYIKENLLEIEELFDENVFSKFPKIHIDNSENCEFKEILEANGIF